MINSNVLDFTNSNLLDSNIVGKATINSRRGHAYGRRRRNYSNAGGSDIDYGALATATAGLASTIASRPRNESKDAAKMQKKQMRQEKRSAKKDLKTVCGRKPLLKKKRGTWDKCVAEYMKTKQPTVPPVESSQSYKTSEPSQDYSSQDTSSKSGNDGKILGMKQSVAIPVIIGVVAIAGFFVYKKFFANKGASVPAPTAV